MNPEVFTCRSDETELEILTIMSQKQIRHMAVMLDESVIGLVTLDEAVKQRLHKERQLNELAVHEPDNEKRLALVDRHLKESWNIFEVFRAVCSVQDDMGLTLLSDRTKQLLWLVGDAEDTGNPLRLKDLTYGADPTLARRLGLERQWLHAVSLGFEHPSSGDRIVVTSEYPADLATALARLRESA